MKKTYTALLVLFILALVFYLLHPAILTAMAKRLIVSDPLKKADLILVLAGDNNGERVKEGVALYKEGYAPNMLMSGGALAWQLTSADVMKRQAAKMGAPPDVILTQGSSESTYEDARFSLPIVKKNGFKSIILVTSPTHTRRAGKVFKKMYSKAGIEIIVRPAQKSKFVLKNWWTRTEDTQLVIWEYVSLVYYFFKGY